MNWVDILIILILLGFVFAAYSAGLIREVITLVAVVAGVIIAGLLYDNLAADVIVFDPDEDGAHAISFLVLFGAVFLLGQIAAYVFKRGASFFMLGRLDHMGGAAFGLLKGLVVVQVLLIMFAAYPSLELSKSVGDSELGKFFVDDVSFVLVFMPGEIGDRVDDFLAPTPPPEPA
jgi:membrane protein required for colicin V production